MKYFISLSKKNLLLLAIFGSLLLGCKNNSKNKNAATNGGAYVTIKLEDGRTIDLNVKRQKGHLSSSSSTFSVNMSDYKSVIRLTLRRYKETIENKRYESPEVQLSILSVTKDSPFEETYRSFNENEDGKEGSAEVNLTSIGKTHAEGTFKGTLYSKNHKKAVVEGKFITEE